jgi:Tol biopolymer transport system component
MTVNPAPVDVFGQPEYHSGPFTLNVRDRTLRRDGVLLHLTPREYQIAECLFRNPGRAVPAEEMLVTVWGTVSVGENNLARQISNLRKRLGKDADGQQYVRSAGNQAYFVPVFALPPDVPDGPPPRSEEGVPSEVIGAMVPPMRPGNVRAAIAGVALVVAVVVAAAAVRIISNNTFIASVIPTFTQVALTHDSEPKSGPVFTDGSRVYFAGGPDSAAHWMTVPISGGDPSAFSMPVPGAKILDVAPGGRMLLITGGRNNQAIWILKDTHSAPERLPTVAQAAGAGRFSPDGKRILLVTDKAKLTMDARTGALLHRVPSTQFVLTPRWTPDGRAFTFARSPIQSGEETLVTSSPDGTKERILDSEGVPPSLKGLVIAGWLDTRTLIVEETRNDRTGLWAILEDTGGFFHGSNRVSEIPGCVSKGATTEGGAIYAVCDAERAELLARSPAGEWTPLNGGADATELDYSVDGKQIAFTRTSDWTVWTADADGSHARQIPTPGLEAHHPHWSPDLRRIAFMGISATGQAHVFFVDVSATPPGTPERVLMDGEQGVPTWSRDGKTLLWGDLRRGQPAATMSLHALDMTTRNTWAVPGSGNLWSPRWSRDGKHVLALSPDSHQLFVADSDGSALPQSASGWRKVADLPNITSATFAPDSRSIVMLNQTIAPSKVSLLRFDLRNEKLTLEGDATDFSWFGPPWIGVALDGRPLALRRTLGQQVYRFTRESR